jgi:beta-xylosidase
MMQKEVDAQGVNGISTFTYTKTTQEDLMKRSMLFVGTILLALTMACGASPTEQPVVQPAEPQVQPTNTESPPTATLEPTPTTDPSLLFRDDFEGKLAEGWNWIGEDATHWNLTDAPGFVRIIAQGGGIGGDAEPQNFLVRAAPSQNFEIETSMTYDAQGSALQFGRAFAECGSPDFCRGNALYFDNPTPPFVSNFVTPVSDPSNVYLRLRREGDVYAASFSEDGSQWTEIGRHSTSITPLHVGLIASQAMQEEKPADFDYFLIRSMP